MSRLLSCNLRVKVQALLHFTWEEKRLMATQLWFVILFLSLVSSYHQKKSFKKCRSHLQPTQDEKLNLEDGCSQAPALVLESFTNWGKD